MITLRECLPELPVDPETNTPNVGRSVLCPHCGAPGTVKPSRQYLNQQRANPRFAIVDCTRCGKTQWPVAKEVELVLPPVPPKVVKHAR